MSDQSSEVVKRPGHRLAVLRLTLSDFRGFEFQRLETEGKSVALVGPNGAGKTNLLEAVSLLAPGRGLRRAKGGDLARRDSDQNDMPSNRLWGVAATVETALGEVDLGTGRIEATRPGSGARERRAVKVDGQLAKSQTVLADYFACAWLIPQMDRLFLDGSSGRRRFLDRLAFGLDASHARRVSSYEHAMRERIKLLKSPTPDGKWLEALEEQMASHALAIAAARRDLVKRLDMVAKVGHGPFPGARISLLGDIENWLDQDSALAVEDRFREKLAANRRIDGARGVTILGVHRSDLIVRHAPKNQEAALCSTGEQKALLIGLVLANARLLTLENGQIPVLLLDEIAAHLDSGRREALFAEISQIGAQAWYTGTDVEVFDSIAKNLSIFDVREAGVSKRKN